MPYPNDFLTAMQHLLKVEGGWADRPPSEDPGGPTMYGITLATFNRYRKQVGSPRLDKTQMREFLEKNPDYVKDIYFNLYWAKVAAAPAAFRLVLFDIVVLQGVRGLKIVQEILGIRQDGIVGPQTVGKLEERAGDLAQAEKLHNEIASNRLEYLRTRAHWDKNKNGWTNRIFYMAARGKEAALSGLDEHEEEVLLTENEELLDHNAPVDNKEKDMDETKNPFASGTIWAGIAQLALATLGFLGIDIAPGDAELVMSNVAAIAVAVTGILTIWRRYAATAKLK